MRFTDELRDESYGFGARVCEIFEPRILSCEPRHNLIADFGDERLMYSFLIVEPSF